MKNDFRAFHEITCEEQPEEFDCICDRLAEERYDAVIDEQLLDILGK
jgi:hypothetical protein